jgi:hypothetical protein
MFPHLDTLEAYRKCSSDEKMQVRDALYANSHLIDAYLQKNPDQFPDEKLEIIGRWRQFIAGQFYIERFLKKYAVFISADDQVYGVLGLHDPFDVFFHPAQLPVLIKTVLLPFKGQIVYDGLLQTYRISFGRGISSNLKEAYLAAKQQGRIIESLDPDRGPTATKKSPQIIKDWRPELDELMANAKKLRAGSDQPAVLGPAFGLVKASLELAQAAAQNPDDLDGLWKSLRKVGRALRSVETTLDRSERFR